jgi:hypothetical protein
MGTSDGVGLAVGEVEGGKGKDFRASGVEGGSWRTWGSAGFGVACDYDVRRRT